MRLTTFIQSISEKSSNNFLEVIQFSSCFLILCQQVFIGSNQKNYHFILFIYNSLSEWID